MAKKRRVFEIAKELGVESKAIVDKCSAEGLEDITNHMSAISLGLEATIREWFSTSEGGTAIETSEKIDLDKVRAKPRRRKAAKAASADSKSETAEETATATTEEEPAAEPAEAPVEQPVAAEAADSQPGVSPEQVAGKAKARSRGPMEEPVADVTPVVAPEAEASEPPAPAEPLAPAAKAPASSPSKPSAPAPVRPAGQRLVTPAAAQLKGPKVVRIEKPEEIPLPRQRRPEGPGGGRGPQPMDPAGGSDIIRSVGPSRGRGVERSGPATDKDDDAARSPRRRRGGSERRGRSAEAEVWFKGAQREQDLIEREERLSHAAGFMRQRRIAMRKRESSGGAGSPAATPAEVGGRVEVEEPITIKTLSAATGIKAADILKFLFNKGVMATINATIDADAAMEMCLEHDIELAVKEAQTAEEAMVEEIGKREPKELAPRRPIVAVLGHVDHGKTSLLDKIRQTNRAAGEAGGITQHIGAFRASITGGDGKEKSVVFLDTPGHQAFTNMRARGANLADLVVLVVAADDGVMPQTIESIHHAQAAEVPIVVAMNKIDKPEATDSNIQKILGQLAEHNLNPVEWGGSTEVMKVSATTGKGVNELIEILDYQADLLELKSDHQGPASGQVIEAELHPGRGPLARIMVQEGMLKVGDFIVAGRGYGKVRSMTNDLGEQVAEAGPSTPVELSGLDEIPNAGDRFYVTDSLRKAEEIADQRRDKERRKELAERSKITLDNVFDQMKSAGAKELRIVLKADVQGSIEVLRKALEDQATEQVGVKVLHAAVGGVTESDVLLADASNAVVIGFHVIASAQARSEAEHRGVDVRLYQVIYDIVDDVKRALEGMLAPVRREEVLGHAEVRQVFRVSKVGAVAGCYVTDGIVRRTARVRITRGGIVVENNRLLEQLKRFKDDAKDVRAGMECGMKVDAYDDIHVGDIIECYETTEVKAKLS